MKTKKQIQLELKNLHRRNYIGIELEKTEFAYFAGASDTIRWILGESKIKASRLILSKPKK